MLCSSTSPGSMRQPRPSRVRWDGPCGRSQASTSRSGAWWRRLVAQPKGASTHDMPSDMRGWGRCSELPVPAMKPVLVGVRGRVADPHVGWHTGSLVSNTWGWWDGAQLHSGGAHGTVVLVCPYMRANRRTSKHKHIQTSKQTTMQTTKPTDISTGEQQTNGHQNFNAKTFKNFANEICFCTPEEEVFELKQRTRWIS